MTSIKEHLMLKTTVYT